MSSLYTDPACTVPAYSNYLLGETGDTIIYDPEMTGMTLGAALTLRGWL